MPENSRFNDLQEIVAGQKISMQAEIVKLSGEWSGRVDQLFHNHLSQLTDQIEASVSRRLDEAAAAAGHKASRAANEALNQLIRRLKQCRSTEEVATWLVDSTSSFCGQAALFEISGTGVRAVCARGFDVANPESLEALEAPLAQAPAFAQAVQERDTVIAIGSPAEVSPQVVETLAHSPDEKAYLFPILIQERVAAILYATAGRSAIDSAAIELLGAAAGNTAQILVGRALADAAPPVSGEPAGAATGSRAGANPATDTPELISIEGVDLRAHAGRKDAMFRQALDARARWFARAEVARIRLFQSAALERGRRQRNIYRTLKPEIDAARSAYRKDFVAVSPVIADYFHRELLGLVNDDTSLLGPEYPGSLV